MSNVLDMKDGARLRKERLEREDSSVVLEERKSGGGGGGMEGLEKRVGNLETKMDKVQETLGAIQVTLAEIKGGMKGLVTKDDFHALKQHVAVLDERTNKLATTRGVATMFSIATAALTLLGAAATAFLRWSAAAGHPALH